MNKGDFMNINYQLTKQDYIEFNIFHMSYSNSIRKILFVQRYFVSIIFLITPFIVSRIINEISFWFWLPVFIIVYLLWVIFYPKYFYWFSSRRISRMVDEGKNADMLGSQSLELTEDRIVNISSFSESKTDYRTVERVVETKDYIYIYISSVMAYIIPIRTFESLDQKTEFINMLNSNINKHIV